MPGRSLPRPRRRRPALSARVPHRWFLPLPLKLPNAPFSARNAVTAHLVKLVYDSKNAKVPIIRQTTRIGRKADGRATGSGRLSQLTQITQITRIMKTGLVSDLRHPRYLRLNAAGYEELHFNFRAQTRS